MMRTVSLPCVCARRKASKAFQEVMSCTEVTPNRAASFMAARRASSSSCGVAAGMSRETRACAESFKMPVGSPVSGSRTINAAVRIGS